jgi:carbonic anhydrase/acetyltransferase-like protein (isoleucine patch superfamily)
MIGDVELGSGVSVWFNAVIRGDVNSIRIGNQTNVQDGAILHVTHRSHALEIGSEVVIDHAAVVHGCRLERGSLIGIGSRVLDGAVVGEGAQVGAGALVTPWQRVPARHLAVGVPARVVRPLREEESQEIATIASRYSELRKSFRSILGSGAELVR